MYDSVDYALRTSSDRKQRSGLAGGAQHGSNVADERHSFGRKSMLLGRVYDLLEVNDCSNFPRLGTVCMIFKTRHMVRTGEGYTFRVQRPSRLNCASSR